MLNKEKEKKYANFKREELKETIFKAEESRLQNARP